MEIVKYFDVVMMLFYSLIWLVIIAFLRLKKSKSLVYLFFFTIFYIYIVNVLDYTLFQFQSLLLLKYFAPNLILNGQAAGESMNLIPLISLTPEDLKTSLLNILLLMPFGFGLPFITSLRLKQVTITGLLFSISIELLQLITGLLANTTFRITDINDVLFNTVGAIVGYVLSVGFMRFVQQIFSSLKAAANPILRYIAQRPQISK